ncbi:hypothetical protein BH20ACT18_BH20ACT18_13040 [soil metagenome]
MPIYEYRCDNGHTFEVLQRMADPPIVACEACEAPVKQVFHPIAVHFKGKGFYNTDYGTKNRQRETAAAGEGSGGDGKGESTKDGKKDESKKGDEKKSEAKKGEGAKKAESSATSSKSPSASKSD